MVACCLLQEGGEEAVQPKSGGGGRKEKSVLQAKLTKLAIQIGYAGMPANMSINQFQFINLYSAIHTNRLFVCKLYTMQNSNLNQSARRLCVLEKIFSTSDRLLVHNSIGMM